MVIKYIGLRGLKKDDILEHLRERDFSEMEINSIAVDAGLVEILRFRCSSACTQVMAREDKYGHRQGGDSM